MNETLKRLGAALRTYFASDLRRPLNWRMIDALETIKEKEAGSVNPQSDERDAKPHRDRQL